MAGNVALRHYRTSDLISKFGRLAQTSQYYVRIAPDSIRSGGSSGFKFDGSFVGEDLGMYCSEASLPGNSFATTEMTTDFPGVSQKFPYRKIYNDLQLTFYVDSSYNVIKFFEDWMSHIASPNGSGKAINEEGDASFRFNYPNNYKCNIFVAKFNKDNELKNKIAYRFVNAFPVDITSMPVSYDSSDVLKCSVSFAYDRYIFDKTGKLIASVTPPSTISANDERVGFGAAQNINGFAIASQSSESFGSFGGAAVDSSVGFQNLANGFQPSPTSVGTRTSPTPTQIRQGTQGLGR